MEPAVGLALILLLGVGSQVLAWKMRLPSILVLLLCGLAAGPLSTLWTSNKEPWLDPDALFGDLLLPLVGLSVGLILYEGGLTLRLREIARTKRVVWNLCTVGALVSWGGTASAALLLIDGIGVPIAVLFGAIMVVTGPTVIGPLLSHIRPTGESGPILKWEGIVIDPLGALLAVLVFELIAASQSRQPAAGDLMLALARTLVVGVGLGALAAWILQGMIRRYWVPDYLQNPVSLLLVVVVFVVCDKVQAESGLLATTVMGIVLANQSSADVRHIIEFKENLRVLLIALLFVVLGARLDLADFRHLGWESVVFVGVLIVIVRPLGVLAATSGMGMPGRDRLFMAWMAPRGIVAAAVASLFGIALEPLNVRGAEYLVPLAFMVIIGTVAVYGISAPMLARRLGLSDENPQGVIILGGHSWAREIGLVLQNRGVRVLLVDSNRDNIRAGRMEGLATYGGNVLAEHALEDMDLTGLGRMLALTPNDEVNALACQRFGREFGRREVYQVPSRGEERRDATLSKEFRGRTLFDSKSTFSAMASRHAAGHIVKATTLSEAFGYADYRRLYGPRATVLFVLGDGGSVRVETSDDQLEPQAGETIVSLVDPDDLLLG